MSDAFYFLRHGQTDANAQDLIAGGGWDVDLNPTGIAQAQAAARILQAHAASIRSICSSSMLRTRQTTAIAAVDLRVPTTFNQDLVEWHVGQWERTSFSAVAPQFLGDGEPPDGETRDQFRIRVKAGLRSALAQPASVLIVSHGGVWQRICELLDMPVTRIENCVPHRVCRIAVGGRWAWQAEKLEF